MWPAWLRRRSLVAAAVGLTMYLGALGLLIHSWMDVLYSYAGSVRIVCGGDGVLVAAPPVPRGVSLGVECLTPGGRAGHVLATVGGVVCPPETVAVVVHASGPLGVPWVTVRLPVHCMGSP